MVALQTKKGVPLQFMEIKLCEKFHCLPSQLRKESWEDIDMILGMAEIEQQFSERDNRLSTSKYGHKSK